MVPSFRIAPPLPPTSVGVASYTGSSDEDTSDEAFARHTAALSSGGAYFQPVPEFGNHDSDAGPGCVRLYATRAAARKASAHLAESSDGSDGAPEPEALAEWYSLASDAARWGGATTPRAPAPWLTPSRLASLPAPVVLTGGAGAAGVRLPPLADGEGASPRLTPAVVARLLGPDFPVPALDCDRQSAAPAPLTAGGFAAYWGDAAARRRTRLNVVSLNLSSTPLGGACSAPAAVRAAAGGGGGDHESLLYCLMSPAGSFTDWHLDFGGSAVWCVRPPAPPPAPLPAPPGTTW